MSMTTSTINNPINDITQMDNINQYKQDISMAPLNAKRKKYIAKYNLIKTIENMDITLNEKIALSGMSSRKYQIERRIINKYPTLEEFTDTIDNDSTLTFEKMTYKTPKQASDVDLVYRKIGDLLCNHNMLIGSPQRNEVATKLAINNTIELFSEDDNYFRYGDCLICGEPIVGNGVIRHIDIQGTKIPYTSCDCCQDEEVNIEDVLLLHYRYGIVMRQAYEEIVSAVV